MENLVVVPDNNNSSSLTMTQDPRMAKEKKNSKISNKSKKRTGETTSLLSIPKKSTVEFVTYPIPATTEVGMIIIPRDIIKLKQKVMYGRVCCVHARLSTSVQQMVLGHYRQANIGPHLNGGHTIWNRENWGKWLRQKVFGRA